MNAFCAQAFSSINRGNLVFLLSCILAAGLSACASNDDRSVSAIEKPDALIRLADTALAANDYPAAIGFYRRAIANGVNTIDVELGLADAFLGAGSLEYAAAQYNVAKTMAPTRAEPDIGLGRVYLSEHKPAIAYTYFEAARREGAHGPALYNNEGIALDQQRRHAEAQLAYRTGLAESPDNKNLRGNYGLSLALSGQYEHAIAILTDLAQEPGATPKTRQNLAFALGVSGDKEAAKRVASHDLDPEAVENNLRYYSAVRGSAQKADLRPSS